MHSMYNNPCNNELDDSDSEEMLPTGAFWPIPESEEWTVVKRSHGNLGGTIGSGRDRFQNPGKKLDYSGLGYGQLDDINESVNHDTEPEVLLISQNEVGQIDDTPLGTGTAIEMAIVNVKPVVCKRPNVIVVTPSKITDRQVNRPVNAVLTPRAREYQNRGIVTQAGELSPKGLKVVPAEMAEEASAGDIADNQPQNKCELDTKTTAMNSSTNYDGIVRPAPRRVPVEVTEDPGTDDTTIESTKRKVSTELLEIPQQWVTRGFLTLAEEARIVKVGKTQSFLVEEVLPQITEVTGPRCEAVSGRIEEDLGQSVDSLREGIAKVPTVRFDVGQLMQWPDVNSAGVMICGSMLKSEMPSLGFCAARG